jgi:predicted DNA-binding protein YlxM (UPF0122 family)
MKIKSAEDIKIYWGQYASKEARRERFERIYTLYIQEGLSLQQIADQFGISKQRVHQILLKESKEPELLAVKKRADMVERNTWRTKEMGTISYSHCPQGYPWNFEGVVRVLEDLNVSISGIAPGVIGGSGIYITESGGVSKKSSELGIPAWMLAEEGFRHEQRTLRKASP